MLVLSAAFEANASWMPRALSTVESHPVQSTVGRYFWFGANSRYRVRSSSSVPTENMSNSWLSGNDASGECIEAQAQFGSH